MSQPLVLTSEQDSSKIGVQALVVGGSIAGLLAARVLLDYFDRVILLERDEYPEHPKARAGVPQGTHVHGLLLQGQQILEELFPGFEEDLKQKGAIALDWINDWQFMSAWGWLEQHDSGLVGLCCSRLLIEWYLRQRLLQYSGFELRAKTSVKALKSNTKGGVEGVLLKANETSEEVELLGDLVVDTTGRNSRLPQWFSEMGFEEVEQTKVNAFLGYSSRWYRQPKESSFNSAEGILIASSPGESSKGGVLYPVEDNHWVVTLSGIQDDQPPSDEQGFNDFMQSLREPHIYERLKDAEPSSPIYSYRRTENQWRHFEKMSAFPAGIIAMGDAVCCFNPVYGQGMTASAMGAKILQDALDKLKQSGQVRPKFTDKFGMQFQKDLAQGLQAPWLMATGEDFRWPATTGDRPNWISKLIQAYIDRVMQLSRYDSKAHKLFIEVMHLVKSPWVLMSPDIMFKAFFKRA